MSSIWNPDNVRDVAESVGLASLTDNVVEELARDVDYRLAQVLEEALKFMRHSRRTTLSTHDISNALKILNVEPLYGYESTRPLRFGEASLGPGQPLYYVEDEEVDFEKLINAPLPKVPREITFTAHWLAVEGVQPSIPQNPTASNHADMLPKGPNANPHIAAANGLDNVSVKPLVKHVLSKESQELFAKLSSALLDETNPEWQNAALASIQTDPGIHQLVTYLLAFIAEKVTHCMNNIFVLRSMLQATEALLANPTIYLDPYIPFMVSPVLTCCTGKHVGPSSHAAPSNASSETLNGNNLNGHRFSPHQHFQIRELAASLLHKICRNYASSNQSLKARIARICLKYFLDPNKTLGTHYGALQALRLITGREGTMMLIMPNLRIYDEVLKEAMADESKKPDADRVLAEILYGLDELARSRISTRANGVVDLVGQRQSLTEKVGEVVAERIIASDRTAVAQVIMEANLRI
ncbi:unnamed protein product [Periconia digitata]|uniref:TBP-associated factor 6 n=1 Tax=Periconia digitata TaxID=1303443 RepID=A0A9W4U5V9_9PLEO|nr:unnamed protein product [Periconia digitata]